jgi:hypothetical protein
LILVALIGSLQIKISIFVRLRNLVASDIFWLPFFAVEKESLDRKDLSQNHQGRWREACLRSCFTFNFGIGIN